MGWSRALAASEGKKKPCKSEVQQFQGYSKETVLEFQGTAWGRDRLQGAEEQQGAASGLWDIARQMFSALGHTTRTKALVPSPAPGATARKTSQGKHRQKQHFSYFPPFQKPVTWYLGIFTVHDDAWALQLNPKSRKET